ncbi:beta-lactamase domain protein [Caldithrix abyssi DSM 13497]|uniref:Beta-lactamase domain protein n=1 Tax=Caldithrix abyssi DSM 13497 TaxID=880073 RepID=H1XU84_CALAY|nr:MBL fold metallo-hydrolase [Caldithrix abyssi]APF17474.1 Glyoxylase, beta-lactamase superfamily II [Caldithrix abyssi DSM 13497]EHO41574.1 beta-lactamase domain protein [Caldithrix abyssi DSM 13497]
MRIIKIPVGPFEVNCYIVVDEESNRCFLIDPGDEPEKIIKAIEEHHLTPTRVINTHNHIDHARHLYEIKQQFKIPFYIHEADLPLLEALKEQALFFGLNCSSVPEVDGFLEDGEEFEFGNQSVKILHTPGHSPGSVSVYLDGHVFVGDVLFKGSIGRTDLYGGNYNVLLESIKNKLLTLPEATVVHAGHGEDTTIGDEKRNNPFLRTM